MTGVEKNFHINDQKFQLLTYLEESCNNQTGKENPKKKNRKEALKDAKLFETLGSGLNRKTFQALNDFSVF